MKRFPLTGWLLVAACALANGQSVDTTEYPLSTTAAPLTVRAPRILHGELATQRISQLEIYRNPAAKADPLLAVNTLPAATNPDETANVSLRGSPAAATGVYLNGVPLRSAVRLDQSNGIGQFSILGQLPVRELRVYPSSPPLPFSQASAGVVAIETGNERPQRTGQGISLNLVGLGYSHARPLGRRSWLRGFVNTSDLTALRALNGRKLNDLQASRSVDGALAYGTELAGGSTLQLVYLGFAERYDYAVRTPDQEGRFSQRKPRHLGVANYRWTRRGWAWRVNQAVDWEKPRYTFLGVTESIDRLTTHTALHAERRWPGLTVQTGAVTNVYLEEGVLRQTLETYAYLQRRLGRSWLLGGGLKPVYDGRTDLNLQFAARYDPGRRHRLNLTAGSHRQLLAPDGDYFGWQTLRLRQLSLEHRYRTGNWQLESAVYAKVEDYSALGRVRVAGAEARLAYDYRNWYGEVGLTSVRSRGASPTGRDIPLSLRSQLRWAAAGWSLGLIYRGRSGKVAEFTAPSDPVRYPGYERLDFAVSKLLVTPGGLLTLYANANNLLDTKNISYYSLRGEEYYSRRVIFFGAVFSW